ncbi:4-alpha-glucanotransferase [Rhodovulum steppense]|uniref:4-alpha-glucanotransferase n=1 Tax=Rhodovulum steppense TaxID=540251 RepID=A0A4R1Z330_9RHOB|nr:4-alpha-glucanotransferase [Rhodovulum steppense]TCM87623.1 4-alpha-glucanotransferase [Rhodovulum steppense]
MSPALAALAARAGILPRYVDLAGATHDTGPETAQALLAAMGLAAASEAEAARTLAALDATDAARPLPDWIVVEAGTAPVLHPRHAGAWQLSLEDGTCYAGRAQEALSLPPLPPGLHDLTIAGHRTTLLSAPPRLPLPPRGWGVTVPLYGLRDAETGGLGDYADLCAVVAGIGALGAGFVGINPIHAGFPGDPQAISPYSPSSRRRFSTAHLACPGEVRMSGGALVDYAPAIAARLTCLRAAFAAIGPGERAAKAGFRAAEGADLDRFALHQALSDRFGPYWSDWPEAYRAPDTPEVRAFAAENLDAIAFHAWLQFRAERQLGDIRAAARDAGMAHGLYLDLAVGTHPAGAETWADPGLFARGATLGAPPDPFAPQGQNWSLAPMIPQALAARGFRPLAEILRAQLRFAGLLRIDHILGFERAFWVPGDGPGAYVAMPKPALLAVARIEAARAGAVIVGEDLGVVPEGLRADLAASGILGCRLAMFEPHPETWPEAVMASFGTHDLPPFAGWRQGLDIDWHARLGHVAPGSLAELRRCRADAVADLARRAGGEDVEALHGYLGATPARLVALQIEDLLGRTDQANLPGTVETHPNWRRRIGPGSARLAQEPMLSRAAAAMRRSGRQGAGGLPSGALNTGADPSPNACHATVTIPVTASADGSLRLPGQGTSQVTSGGNAMAKGKPEDDRIQEAAYHIWNREGRPEGKEEEHWFRAIEELQGATETETPARAKPARKKTTTKPKKF